MTKPYDPSADRRELEKAVNTLMEHFDCVQVFVSRHMEADHEGTVHQNFGAGNWFARYGQVSQWVTQEEARMMDESTGD